jgi:diadenylate cyclase
VEDLVTVRDVADVLQRAEMVRRIAAEVEGYVIELGTDGRLVQLQLEELTSGVDDDLRLVVRDYFVRTPEHEVGAVLDGLAALHDDDLLDPRVLALALRLPPDADLDTSLTPKGYRVLAKIPRLSGELADRVVARFDSLAKLMRAGIGDLVEIEGIGEVRARMVKDGLSRLAEASILERYS